MNELEAIVVSLFEEWAKPVSRESEEAQQRLINGLFEIMKEKYPTEMAAAFDRALQPQ